MKLINIFAVGLVAITWILQSTAVLFHTAYWDTDTACVKELYWTQGD